MDTIRLLIVDDEAEFRAATRKALVRRGFDVSEAASGAEALKVIPEAEPDVVLLDLRMEEMDGIETLREIRAIEAELPVIILTGHGQVDDAVAGINLDIVDFLHKPVDVELLASHIRRLLTKGGAPLRERTIAELMVPAASYAKVYDDEPLSVAVEKLRDAFFRRVAGRVTEIGHRSVLVFDRKERFVGILHVHDVVGAVVPSYQRGSPYSSAFTGLFLANAKMLGRLKAGDLADDTAPIDVDTPLMGAAEIILSRRTINLPVARGAELVGVLRDKDLLLEISEALGIG